MMGMVFALGKAQNITDGLRYSFDNTTGSARYSAMGGAFGALGGEISSIAFNPAGSAVFLGNAYNFSTTFDDIDNTSTYFGTTQDSGDDRFTINQAGAVFVFPNYKQDSPWKKFTMGLNYNRQQTFHNDLFIRGTGDTSISEFFLQQAQGIPLNLLETQSGESISSLYRFLGETEGVSAQNAFLGYQGFIIDPVNGNPNNTQYVSAIAPGSYNQEYSYFTRGYQGKFTFNFGTQYGENLFFGVNLNSHNIDYEQANFLREVNSNQGSTVTNVGFENLLNVRGWAFSAQFGAIIKVDPGLRFGITYDTPTWYEIQEETAQYLETRSFDEEGNSFLTVVNPLIINIFQTYKLNVPGRFGASAAYVFGGQGLISFDYSYRDFSNIQFKPSSDPFFAQENTNISNLLGGVSSVKVGAEYRIKQLSLRGGYRYENSPYKNGRTVGDLNSFSGGLGYNFGAFSLDFAYVRTSQDRNQQLYDIGLTDSARVESTLSNYILTFGWNLL